MFPNLICLFLTPILKDFQGQALAHTFNPKGVCHQRPAQAYILITEEAETFIYLGLPHLLGKSQAIEKLSLKKQGLGLKQ